MNADGTNLQRLTDSPARDFEPDWSPDGQSIVFSSDRDDPANAQLYVMDADGNNQRALMPFVAADFVAPRWSPDGKWILMHSNQLIAGQPWFEIYKVRADGTELTNLSNTPGNNFRADWSPDGTRIVFASERDGNRELYVMNADGSNQVRLTNNQADDNRPRWSPDGKKILFESNRDGDNTALYVMDAPATTVADPQEDKIRLLTFPGFNSQAGAWAVDGAKIVFSADRDSGSDQNWDIYIMDADGGNLYRLTADPELDRFPAWTR
jgi:TolB protein